MGLDDELGDITDERVIELAKYTLMSLHLKPEKWFKMYTVEANANLIQDFLDKTDFNMLHFSIASTGSLHVSKDWPAAISTKACYFIKKSSTQPPSKTDPLYVSYQISDMSYSPLDYTSTFFNEVMIPIVTNKLNHVDWPSAVSDDIIHASIILKRDVDLSMGQLSGKTLLPVPPNLMDAEKLPLEPSDRNILHSIETVVIEWASQISVILKQDSKKMLMDDENALPIVELEFWKDRALNLSFVSEQLNSPRVKHMADILKHCNSIYYQSFQTLFMEVTAALHEAEVVDKYLMNLRSIFEEMVVEAWTELDIHFSELFNEICEIWAESKFYSSSHRMKVLLKETCNLIIDMAKTYLEPTDLFKAEIDDDMVKVIETEKIIKAFKDAYLNAEQQVTNYFPDDVEPQPWQFSSDEVLEKLNNFYRRILLLKKILETSDEFNKLEKIVVGGLEGKSFTMEIESIYVEFMDEYKVFQEKSYDTSDWKNEEFLEDYQKFKEKVSEFDRRLATVICRGFDECTELESYFKVILLDN
ncbi:hypothetical protein Ahia01_000041400 [Argonauta hians]